MTAAWPIATLRPRQITRHILARTTAGTISASGFAQRVASPAQGWVIKYEGIVVATFAQRRAWDALAALLDGGATPVLVYLVENDLYFPAPGQVAANAAAGDTAIDINDPTIITILPGHHFSIGERLYRAVTVAGPVANDWTIGFRPPLREAVTIGAAVSWTTLAVRCRLASDDQMMLAIDPAGIGVGNVSFVEDPTA